MVSVAMAIVENKLQPLNELNVGDHARIVEALCDKSQLRRLLSLGVRVGSELEILHFRSRGVVVASDGNRVALGAGVAEKLLVERLEN